MSHYRDRRGDDRPHHSGQKRARNEPAPLTPEQRLKSLLLALGDDQSKLATQLPLTVDALSDDIAAHSPLIVEILTHCLTALPTKTGAYAAVIGLLAVKHVNVRDGIVSAINAALQTAIANSQHNEVRILVRAIVALSAARVTDCANIWSLARLIGSWVSGSESWAFRDYYIYTLLSFVPYIAADHSSTEDFQSLMVMIGALMTQRQASLTSSSMAGVTSLCRVFNAENDDGSPVSEDTIAALYAAITGTTVWVSELIVRPHTVSSVASELAKLEPSAHDFAPLFELTPTADNLPIVVPTLSIFRDDQLSSDSQSHSTATINRFVLFGLINDLLVIFEPIHRECVRQLLLLPAQHDFAPLLIETLLSNLFALPHSNQLLVYYATIIIDLFKAEPTIMPPILGLAINTLFERLDELDAECFDRLVDWFAFHLSNFIYQWPWDNWNAVLETDDYTPQRMFVREVFAKITRLAFWERIQQSVPAELLALMPDQPQPAFRFDLATNDSGLNSAANSVVTMIREKSPSDAIVSYLSELSNSSEGKELNHSVQLFVPCLLYSGCKSFSHLFALFDRYADIFQSLIKGDNDVSVMTVESVGEFWQHSHQHQLVIADQLLLRGWIDASVLVQWSLNQPAQLLHQRFVWEAVTLAFNHCAETVTNIDTNNDGGSGRDSRSMLVSAFVSLFYGLTRVLKVNASNEGLIAIVEQRIKAVLRHYVRLLSLVYHQHLIQQALSASDARVSEVASQAIALVQ